MSISRINQQPSFTAVYAKSNGFSWEVIKGSSIVKNPFASEEDTLSALKTIYSNARNKEVLLLNSKKATWTAGGCDFNGCTVTDTLVILTNKAAKLFQEAKEQIQIKELFNYFFKGKYKFEDLSVKKVDNVESYFTPAKVIE